MEREKIKSYIEDLNKISEMYKGKELKPHRVNEKIMLEFYPKIDLEALHPLIEDIKLVSVKYDTYIMLNVSINRDKISIQVYDFVEPDIPKSTIDTIDEICKV